MNNLTYTANGDYLLPDMTMPPMPSVPVGKYGRMRKNHLKQHRPILYNRMMLTGKLHQHLTEIDQTATQRLEQMMAELTQQMPPPAKDSDPMTWTAHMNSLKHMAEETILAELVHS